VWITEGEGKRVKPGSQRRLPWPKFEPVARLRVLNAVKRADTRDHRSF